MEFTQRKEISQKLKERMRMKDLKNTEVANMIGVSDSYISQLINDGSEKYEQRLMTMGEKTLNQITVWLGNTSQWKLVDTNNYKLITNICTEAKSNADAYWFVGKQGSGKSQTLKNYAAETEKTWYIECRQAWRAKDFFAAILKTIGSNHVIGTRAQLEEHIVDTLEGQNNPLLILDEIEVLGESIFPMINDLYNCLQNKCGFVVSGTKDLEVRVTKGGIRGKIGYKNFISRFGGIPQQLPPPSKEDIKKVCNVNGINNLETINIIIANSNWDLRQVYKLIRYKLIEKMKIAV